MRDLNLKYVINLFMLMNQLHILFMKAVFCLFAISFCVNRSWVHLFIYIVVVVNLGSCFFFRTAQYRGCICLEGIIVYKSQDVHLPLCSHYFLRLSNVLSVACSIVYYSNKFIFIKYN